jgi:hypothetical protein
MTTITEPVQLEQPPCPPPYIPEVGDTVIVSGGHGRHGQIGQVSCPTKNGRWWMNINAMQLVGAGGGLSSLAPEEMEKAA